MDVTYAQLGAGNTLPIRRSGFTAGRNIVVLTDHVSDSALQDRGTYRVRRIEYSRGPAARQWRWRVNFRYSGIHDSFYVLSRFAGVGVRTDSNSVSTTERRAYTSASAYDTRAAGP